MVLHGWFVVRAGRQRRAGPAWFLLVVAFETFGSDREGFLSETALLEGLDLVGSGGVESLPGGARAMLATRLNGLRQEG
jgi:hypothetical protein